MSLCDINTGYTLNCWVSGGVKKVWLGTYNPLAVYQKDALGVITAATGTNSIYLFDQDVEFATLNEAVTVDRANAAVAYETTLGIKLTHLDAHLKQLLKSLNRAPLFAVVESVAGDFYLLGEESAGRISEGTATVGQAYTDMNGATTSIMFKSQDGMSLIDGALVGSDITVG